MMAGSAGRDSQTEERTGIGFEEGLSLITTLLLVLAVVLVQMELKKYGGGIF